MEFMKRCTAVGLSVILSLAALAAIPAQAQQGPANLSRLGGWFFAGQYNQQLSTVFGGNAATGSATITVYSPNVTLRDGRVVYPFSTSNPITVDIGANAETVTPSAVSGCSANVQVGSCSITATFANTHGQGAPIYSGTGGLYEAAADANANAGGVVVIDSTFTGSAANVTAARALYSTVSIQDLRSGTVSSPQLLVGIGTGVATASQTLYLLSSGAATNAFTNTTATNATHIASRTGTLRNLACSATAAGVGAGSGVVTVRTAPVSSGTFAGTTITATFGTTTAAADTTHTANVTLGQPIQFQVTSAGSETLAGVICTVQLN